MHFGLDHEAVAIKVEEAEAEVGALLAAAERGKHVLFEQLLPAAVLAHDPPNVPALMCAY